MLDNLAITRKIMLSFGILIGASLLASLVVLVNVSRLRHVAEARDTARYVSSRANDMMTGVVEAQSAIRGYVLLGKPEFMATYEENKARIDDAIEDASKHSASPEQKRRFADFGDAVRAWEDDKIARTIALYKDPATRAQALELAGTKQLSGMRKIKKEIDEAQDAATGILDQGRIAAERMVIWALLLGGIAALSVASFFGWWLSRTIAGPTTALSKLMATLAEGRTNIEIPYGDRSDEIGSMAKALMVFREAAASKAQADREQTQVMEEIGTALARVAQSDLRTRVAAFPPAFLRLQEDFNNAMEAMAGVMQSVTDSARGINSGAADIRQASDDLSQRTEQQAASLEETAAAMDEITATVRQTAAGASRAHKVVEEARGEAEQSGEIVRRAVDAMAGIERASSEISQIISVIDGIAFQTNLLALNAGVEAARAGDAGRGFAVVASEVRALAQRSADAAKDVKERITASANQVDAGVELVSETGKALDRITARFGEINTLVAQISIAAEQQATGLQQVNTAVGEMDGVTQQNAAMVEQATAAARSLAVEADDLARQVARFKTASEDRQTISAGAHPVLRLQQRAVGAGRRIAAQARRGGAAMAAASDDWSEF